MRTGSLLIRDVTVISTTSKRARGQATVLVHDGRIAAVGKAIDIAVPEGARVVDGRGKFLIPGLADMHVHLYSDDECRTRWLPMSWA